MSDWTLHLGSCFDPTRGLPSLADRSVDHVITDPPYSKHVHDRNRAGVGGSADGWKGQPISRVRSLGFASLDAQTRACAAAQFARVARRWVAVFSDTESSHLWIEALEAFGLDYVRTMFWRKKNGAPQFTGDRPAVACEAIVLCHQPGRKRWNGGGKQGFYDVAIVLNRGAGETRLHQAQKPIRLMRQLVEDFSDPGEIVCDPFAGSGSTAEACIRAGRSFIGWEKGQKSHAVAHVRLAALAQSAEEAA